MAITIRVLNGVSAEQMFTVIAFRPWTVVDVKARIERVEGIPLLGQRLFHAGRVLSDGETLADILGLACRVSKYRGPASNSAGGRPSGVRNGGTEGSSNIKGSSSSHTSSSSSSSSTTGCQDDKGGAINVAISAVTTRASPAKVPLVVDFMMVRIDAQWAAVVRDIEDGWIELKDVSEAMRGDPSIVTAAVKGNASALQYASEEMRRDRNVVLAAMQSSGLALRYASEELWKDREVVLAAIRRSPLALRYAAEELWHDREFALAAVELHGSALIYVPEELRRDRTIVLAAVRSDSTALQHAPRALHHDPEIKLAASRNMEAFLGCRAMAGHRSGGRTRLRMRAK